MIELAPESAAAIRRQFAALPDAEFSRAVATVREAIAAGTARSPIGLLRTLCQQRERSLRHQVSAPPRPPELEREPLTPEQAAAAHGVLARILDTADAVNAELGPGAPLALRQRALRLAGECLARHGSQADAIAAVRQLLAASRNPAAGPATAPHNAAASHTVAANGTASSESEPSSAEPGKDGSEKREAAEIVEGQQLEEAGEAGRGLDNRAIL